MSDLFDPVDGAWTRVSPTLITLRRLTEALPDAVVSVGLVVAGLLVPGWGWTLVVAGVVGLVVAAWIWRWAAVNGRSWGYAETDRDLLITHGVWWRRLVAVPYGRIQFVDVQAGPLQRWLGIATVTLHTASAETAATILGVPATEATRLRNRLTELGETQAAGV